MLFLLLVWLDTYRRCGHSSSCAAGSAAASAVGLPGPLREHGLAFERQMASGFLLYRGKKVTLHCRRVSTTPAASTEEFCCAVALDKFPRRGCLLNKRAQHLGPDSLGPHNRDAPRRDGGVKRHWQQRSSRKAESEFWRNVQPRQGACLSGSQGGRAQSTGWAEGSLLEPEASPHIIAAARAAQENLQANEAEGQRAHAGAWLRLRNRRSVLWQGAACFWPFRKIGRRAGGADVI